MRALCSVHSFDTPTAPGIRHRVAHPVWMISGQCGPSSDLMRHDVRDDTESWLCNRNPELSPNEVDTRTAQLADGLRLAHALRRGVPPTMEATVRAYARAQREAGADIGRVLVEVKALVRANTGSDEPIFTPRIIGWTVAGFFHGTTRAE